MTKSEVFSKCREILYNNTPYKDLSNEDFNFLMSLFPLHPRWIEKRGNKNIKSVITKKHDTYGNLCFALVFDDNTKVDISFTECVNRPGLKSSIKTACLSAVNKEPGDDKKFNKVVNDWIKTFENQELTIGTYLGGLDGGNAYFTNNDIITNFINYYENT